jgi:hypothetical protein
MSVWHEVSICQAVDLSLVLLARLDPDLGGGTRPSATFITQKFNLSSGGLCAPLAWPMGTVGGTLGQEYL